MYSHSNSDRFKQGNISKPSVVSSHYSESFNIFDRF